MRWRASRFLRLPVRSSNSISDRMSCFPLNSTRYQIWTRDTGAISVTALIFGYISRYEVHLPSFGGASPVLKDAPGRCQQKSYPGNMITLSLGFSHQLFLSAFMLRDFLPFLYWGRYSLTKWRSRFPLNWARYQIWTKAAGEIYFTALIFGYMSLYVAILHVSAQLSRFRRWPMGSSRDAHRILKRQGIPGIS